MSSSSHKALNALRMTLYFVLFASQVTLLTMTSFCVIARIGISEYQLHRAASLVSLMSLAAIFALGMSESVRDHSASKYTERRRVTRVVKYRYPIMEMCILSSLLNCLAIFVDIEFGLGGISIPKEYAWMLWISETIVATTLMLLVGFECYRHRSTSATTLPKRSSYAKNPW